MESSMQSVIDIKKRNIKGIIHYLRGQESATKKQIAAELNLSFASVSNMCNLLEENRLISGSRNDAEARVGRSPKPVRLIDNAVYIAAADLHKTGTATLRLYDLRGNIASEVSFLYEATEIGEFVSWFSQKYHQSFHEEQRSRVVGIGVAVSCIYDVETKLVVASELKMFERQPLKAMLEDRLHIPVYIENESNLCAFSFSQRENTPNLLYVYLDEGLGIGVVNDGKRILGHRGYSSEICHAPLGRLDRACHLCGNRDCMQTDLSVYGFAEKYSGREQVRGNFSDWKDFLAAFDRNEPKAVAVALENAQVLAAGISIIVNLLDPELVVIGGIPPKLYETMRVVAQEVNRSRRVVRGVSDTPFLYDGDCEETVLQGTAEMIYSRWFPNF